MGNKKDTLTQSSSRGYTTWGSIVIKDETYNQNGLPQFMPVSVQGRTATVSNKGFTLVEVLISAVILSIVVFGILRLSGNNASQVGVLEKNRLMNETIYNTRECLKSLDFDTLNALTSTASVNFGADNNGCQIGGYSPDLSFSGIIYKSFDDKGETGGDEIYSYIKVNTGATVMNIENYVSDGTNTKKSTYKIYR